MASGQTLPPQAYTREILTAAFNWLQSQPESVRKLATTPDVLVGLFTRAKRFGNSSLESDAPVSSQNFMSDLKNLAEGLREFEEPRQFTRAAAAAPLMMDPSSFGGQSASFAGAQALSAPMATPVQTQAVPASGGISVAMTTVTANERTRAMIQEVKTSMNLSSDTEAINMMVAVAYKSLKDLLT